MPPLDRIAVGIALAATPLRILLAATTSLTPDEAYYASAASLGTTVPDHPPLVVLGARLGQLLPAALPLELRVRAAPLILGTIVTLLVVGRVRSDSGSPAAQRWAAVLAGWLILPMAGGFLATPDVAVFLATLLLLESETRSGSGWTTSIAAFSATFLGMASKVVMAPIALALVATTRHGWQRRIVLLAAVAASLPVARESLLFQLHHAFVAGIDTAGHVGALPAIGAAVLAQAALWSPIVLFLAVRSGRRLPLGHVAVAGSLTTLFLLSAALRGVPPEPNWLAPAFAPLLPAVAHQLASAGLRMRWAFGVLGPAATLLAVSHVLRPWLPLPARSDPAARLHGSRDLATAGMGAYGPAALRCAQRGECGSIALYIREVRARLESVP